MCSCNSDEILDKEITEEEIQEDIKGLKNNKSPGQDGISNEFYKYSNKDVGDHLYTETLIQDNFQSLGSKV